jgi:hypothetical protein
MRVSTQIFIGVGLGLAGCVWLTLTQPRTQRADLSHQPVFTPLPKASTPTPTAIAPASVHKTIIKILTYDVSFEVHDPISDLVYGEIKDGNNTWVGFTTKKLLAKYPDCKAGTLGVLTRVKASPTPTQSPSPSPSPTKSSSSSPTPFPSKTPSNQPFKMTIEGYTYSYKQSYSTCTDDQAGRNDLAAARAAVKNASLPTLTN